MSGFTSGKVSRDPQPYVWPDVESRLTSGPLRSMFSHGDGIALTYDPRPEYDNHNPVLLELRGHAVGTGILRAVNDQLGALAFGEWIGDATFEQRRHALRVLNKLVALAARKETP